MITTFYKRAFSFVLLTLWFAISAFNFPNPTESKSHVHQESKISGAHDVLLKSGIQQFSFPEVQNAFESSPRIQLKLDVLSVTAQQIGYTRKLCVRLAQLETEALAVCDIERLFPFHSFW